MRRQLLKMTSFVLAGTALLGLSGCMLFRPDYPDHTIIRRVDLEKYAGKWYEIASFPQWFQRGCHCSTAEYTLEEDGIAVTNTCRKGGPGGPVDTAEGNASVVEGTQNTQMKVQFQWPFKGDYWIIALDDEYQYAMVGHPAKKYLWILSRTPTMDPETYQSLVETAREKGYDVSKLERTDQSCFTDS